MSLPRVFLQSGKDWPIRCGHPWIFSGAIARIKGHVQHPRVVEVFDDKQQPLGFGALSPKSKIRVRMLAQPSSRALLEDGATADYFAEVIAAAATRRAWLGLPGARANVYRLVNSEGDGLPGVTIDRLADVLVVQITTSPMFEHRAAIFEALGRLFPDDAILQIEAPKKIQELEGIQSEHAWMTDRQPEEIIVEESGVRFVIRTGEFQKTGHYADMRPHREWIASVSLGKRVLDAYSYTGGFGLHAARGGAAEVVCVDSSAPALARAEQNAAENGFEQISFACSKVDNYLRSAFDKQKRFDVVVLDPPKMAPNKRAVAKATKAYVSLGVEGLRVLEPGGVFCLTSCSEAIGVPELERILGTCASRSGRAIRIVYTGTQGPDHPWPAGMPEGCYAAFVAAFVS